jgi:hypothetical protein
MEDGASGCVLSIPLEIEGEAFAFVTLEDGSLIIEDQLGEESLEQVAAVVERRIERPYRARGFRADASRWVVIADVLDLYDFGTLTGEDVTFVAIGGERRLIVDGTLRPGSEIPAELAAAGDDADPCVISASHVDEQWWELTVEELPPQVGSEPPPAEADEEQAEDPEEDGPAATDPPAAVAAAWTFTATVDAPGLAGDVVELVVADERTVVVLREPQPAKLLAPFRTRIEDELAPPYRARAERQADDTWTVHARTARIERFTHDGTELELTHRGGISSLVVDGVAQPGTVPRLEVVGLTFGGSSYDARATHLRDDLWDVRVDPA